jgi:hypothetical protein
MHRHVLLCPEPEDPEVVGSVNMIRMQVGDPNSIDVPDPGPYELEPKFRGSVDQEAAFRQLE